MESLFSQRFYPRWRFEECLSLLQDKGGYCFCAQSYRSKRWKYHDKNLTARPVRFEVIFSILWTFGSLRANIGGKQLILLTENLNVCWGKHWDSRERKLTVSWGASLQVICYIAGNFEAGNTLNLAVFGSHRSTFFCGEQCTVTLWRHRFCSVAPSKILAGNRFTVRCNVTLK